MAKSYVRYSRELADTICNELSDGRTLRSICDDPGMPSEAAVRQWSLDDVDGFFDRYSRARSIGADCQFDAIKDKVFTASVEDAPLLKIQLETMKWYLSMIAPRRYGDRTMLALATNSRTVVFNTGNLTLPQYEPTPKMIEGDYTEVFPDGSD